MRSLNSALTLALICLALLCPRSTHGKSAISTFTTSPDIVSQLRLDTSIIDREYCSVDEICLTLRLAFTNIGNQPIILDKNSSVIVKHMVSRSVEAAKAGKYLEIVSPFMDMMSILRIDVSPNESCFVILRPGESFSLEKKFGLFIYDGTNDNEDFLHPGNYFLEIVVMTWYYPQRLKTKTREEWNQKGYLWTDPVKSTPLPFNVDNNRHYIAALSVVMTGSCRTNSFTNLTS